MWVQARTSNRMRAMSSAALPSPHASSVILPRIGEPAAAAHVFSLRTVPGVALEARHVLGPALATALRPSPTLPPLLMAAPLPLPLASAVSAPAPASASDWPVPLLRWSSTSRSELLCAASCRHERRQGRWAVSDRVGRTASGALGMTRLHLASVRVVYILGVHIVQNVGVLVANGNGGLAHTSGSATGGDGRDGQGKGVEREDYSYQ